MASENKKILLTGATGFIGGSILSHLLNSPEATIKNAQISCLLRGADRAEKLSSAYGDRVQPILYEGNDDLDTIVAIAAQHDIVINATMGFHSPSAEALVKGLAKRQAATDRGVWIIHTSGVSNIGDKPITNPGLPVRIFDDSADDIYGHQKTLENEQPYAQRTAELGVIDTGLALGVNTLSIISPTIYGPGTGLFNQTSAHSRRRFPSKPLSTGRRLSSSGMARASTATSSFQTWWNCTSSCCSTSLTATARA